MNPYEVLGIEEGAEKAQIKRAYFRLLREHSPEQDPEGFAQIREAYEQLTNAEEGAGAPSLPLPNHPYAKLFAQQIENSLKEGRRKLAKETAQEAWERFPDSLFFLYEMAYTQRICGNTGKAVKNASLLVEKEPENRWFWRELALASYERGYIRKAWPAFVKAYELGCRDFHFIMMFSLECRDYEDYEMGKQILIPLTDPERRWSADDMEDALEAYLALFTMICDLGESGEEEARKYIQFLEKNARSLVSHIPGCVELMGAMILRGKLPADIIRCGIRAIEKINERDPDSSKKEQNRHYMGLLGLARIHSDERVCSSMQYLYELLVMEKDNSRFAMTDCRLCMIQEREKIFGEEAYLREEYPDFYSKAKPYLDRIRSQQDAEKMRYRLQQDYRKQWEFYEEGNYLTWFPEKREEVFGRQVKPSEEPFVRVGKKISRNDPCPCGSGKKYKFCCGRK